MVHFWNQATQSLCDLVTHGPIAEKQWAGCCQGRRQPRELASRTWLQPLARRPRGNHLSSVGGERGVCFKGF